MVSEQFRMNAESKDMTSKEIILIIFDVARSVRANFVRNTFDFSIQGKSHDCLIVFARVSFGNTTRKKIVWIFDEDVISIH